LQKQIRDTRLDLDDELSILPPEGQAAVRESMRKLDEVMGSPWTDKRKELSSHGHLSKIGDVLAKHGLNAKEWVERIKDMNDARDYLRKRNISEEMSEGPALEELTKAKKEAAAVKTASAAGEPLEKRAPAPPGEAEAAAPTPPAPPAEGPAKKPPEAKPPVEGPAAEPEAPAATPLTAENAPQRAKDYLAKKATPEAKPAEPAPAPPAAAGPPIPPAEAPEPAGPVPVAKEVPPVPPPMPKRGKIIEPTRATPGMGTLTGAAEIPPKAPPPPGAEEKLTKDNYKEQAPRQAREYLKALEDVKDRIPKPDYERLKDFLSLRVPSRVARGDIDSIQNVFDAIDQYRAQPPAQALPVAKEVTGEPAVEPVTSPAARPPAEEAAAEPVVTPRPAPPKETVAGAPRARTEEEQKASLEKVRADLKNIKGVFQKTKYDKATKEKLEKAIKLAETFLAEDRKDDRSAREVINKKIMPDLGPGAAPEAGAAPPTETPVKAEPAGEVAPPAPPAEKAEAPATEAPVAREVPAAAPPTEARVGGVPLAPTPEAQRPPAPPAGELKAKEGPSQENTTEAHYERKYWDKPIEELNKEVARIGRELNQELQSFRAEDEAKNAGRPYNTIKWANRRDLIRELRTERGVIEAELARQAEKKPAEPPKTVPAVEKKSAAPDPAEVERLQKLYKRYEKRLAEERQALQEAFPSGKSPGPGPEGQGFRDRENNVREYEGYLEEARQKLAAIGLTPAVTPTRSPAEKKAGPEKPEEEPPPAAETAPLPPKPPRVGPTSAKPEKAEETKEERMARHKAKLMELWAKRQAQAPKVETVGEKTPEPPSGEAHEPQAAITAPPSPEPGQPSREPGGVAEPAAGVGPAVAPPVTGPAAPEGAGGGQGVGQPAGQRTPRNVPAGIERVNQRLDKYEKHFRDTGQHQVADWMGRLRQHVNDVGVKDAMEALGGDLGSGKGAQYEGAWFEDDGTASMGQWASNYLDRYGITLMPPSTMPQAGQTLVSSQSPAGAQGQVARGSEAEYLAGDYLPKNPNFKNKLEESKHLPGLESSEDVNVLAGKPVTHLTDDVINRLDEKYGKGQWIVKAYGDDAFAGHGIFFPQRAAQLKHEAQNAIWFAGEHLARYGFHLKRNRYDKVIGIRYRDGTDYDFGSRKYKDTIYGAARKWADSAAAVADNEHGAALLDRNGKASGKEYMAQPAFPVVGISDEDRAKGMTIKPGQEGRVHIVTRNGKAEAVPHSTWLKQHDLPVVFESEDTRAMAQAAVDAINALPESERNGQIYAPDVVKTEKGYKVVEANPANKTGSSGYLEDNPFVIDAYVSHLTGRTPAHVRFIQRLLSQKRRG
jgi:hypothetical protein